MYTCGPTVYDDPHIGNLRTFVFEDLLRRVLKYLGYEVTHVMNLTDVEDKIIRRALAENKSPRAGHRRADPGVLPAIWICSVWSVPRSTPARPSTSAR